MTDLTPLTDEELEAVKRQQDLSILAKPIQACELAVHSASGEYTLEFEDERRAKIWVVRYARMKAKAEREAGEDGDYNRLDDLQMVLTSRDGTTVTLSYLPKTGGGLVEARAK